MFAKAQKTSGSTLLKNKDAKKLRKDVGVRFECDDAKLLALVPSKSDVRKVSFQAPSRMVVYTVDDTREPVLFDVSGKGDFGFSVYALWRVPDLLPKLTVHAPVSAFVLRGADVMLPGVVFTSADDVASLRKGELRAVYARGNPMAFAVGEVLVDSADIERHGKKGKALRLLHCVGDELWAMGPKSVPNDGFHSDEIVPIDTSGQAAPLSGDDASGGVDAASVDDTAALRIDDVSLEEKPLAAGETAAGDDESGDATVTKDEMDALYVATLLQVLKSNALKEKALPMLASTFHASVFLPNRPDGVTLNVKQSSFKKTSQFLKQMAARGLLSVTERDGVQTITGIARRHPDVLAHTLYRTDDDVKREHEAAASAAAGLPAFVPGQFAPEVEEFVSLNQSLKTMLLSSDRAHIATHFADVSDRKHWRAVDVRDRITAYIDVHGLADARDKKFVVLNAPLTDALFGKRAPAGGYPQRLARPDVLAQLLSKCQRSHRVKLFPGHEPRIVGGELRPLAIHAERSKTHANSVTTSLAYYEQFGIDGAAFAKEAQKKWGSSASTHATPDKHKGDEIRVQGQLVNEVLEHLATKYRINTAKYCVVTYGKGVKAKKKN